MSPHLMLRRVALAVALSPLAIPVVGAARSGRARVSALRYNSEEHRNIVDLGVAAVRIPPNVRFPADIAVRTIDSAAYVFPTKRALRVAIGPNGATSDAAQDNCYWHNYAQRASNLVMYLPPNKRIPKQLLTVSAYTASTLSGAFSLGQLAALYGDYRRSTFCDASGRCFLTDADVSNVSFVGGPNRTRAISYQAYCPAAVTAVEYLQDIGAGLIPPYGEAGNAIGNSAADGAYGDAGWWGDEMLRIATTNDWHFASGAVAWYVGMHRLALLYADSARRDPRYWSKALHDEANALHALTDLFALGHVLTNRDSTSNLIMSDASLLNHSTYRWMQNVIRLGGGTRPSARIQLTSTLPAIADISVARKDFMASSPGKSPFGVELGLRARAEHTYHDEFNTSGADVRNLNGDQFTIYGDAGLMKTTDHTDSVLVKAVTASVQALFDAYVSLEDGEPLATIGASGSKYFAALTYLPVYIVHDANTYFTGRWTLYAKAVNEISGKNKPLANFDGCQVKYLSGRDWLWPAKSTSPCATF